MLFIELNYETIKSCIDKNVLKTKFKYLLEKNA